MGYTLKTNYADKSNYGGIRKDKVKYIVIHYTGNDGDTDESNARFFKKKNIKSSANFFVDDDSVTISVPENYVAYAVGGSRYPSYKKTGGAKYYGLCTNNNSISIEMCDTLKDGKLMASEKTMQNTAELVKTLMKNYGVPIENVITHFLVTGKSCPSYFVDNNAWNRFKARLTTPSVPTTLDYSKVLNLSYYASMNKDLATNNIKTDAQLLSHFTTYGIHEQRKTSQTFDVKVYKDNNKDLRDAFAKLGDDWSLYYNHYMINGYKENRKHV